MDTTKKEEVSDYKGVWIFAEQEDGELKSVVPELLGKGKKLANELNEGLAAVLIGSDVEELCAELAKYGASVIYLIEDEIFDPYTTEAYAKALIELISKYKPSLLLYGATHTGRELAPSIAGRMGLGLTADCTGLSITEHNGKQVLLQTRPAFGGNIMAEIICPDTRPQMATVRPNVFDVPESNDKQEYELIREESRVDSESITTDILEKLASGKKGAKSIEETDVIVSGGRGVESEEDFAILRELAKELEGVVGCSRPIVEKGWLSKARQVGQSGKTVSPSVYIACGISGAVQHQVGIRGADTIIAINEDPEAPIFDIADLSIIGDLYEIVPRLTERLKELKK